MLHIINIKVRKRGNRNDLSLRKNLFPMGYHLFQFGLITGIDLVDQQQDRTFHRLDPLEEFFIFIDCLNDIGHIE